jgi:peptidyl-prolyl cis-trans isomerase SurA
MTMTARIARLASLSALALPFLVPPPAHAQSFGQSGVGNTDQELEQKRVEQRLEDEGKAPTKVAPDRSYEPQATPITKGGTPQSVIAAVVNGDVLSDADVDARAKLFALSTGLPLSPDVIDHLKPQVIRSLIDERLRLQEIERRKIVVGDTEIAAAIQDIEARNRMKPGSLALKLAASGVPMRTLIDELRVQIGWTRVLREALGNHARVTPADIAQQHAIAKAEAGKPEYDIAEIFIPFNNPAHADQARAFTNTVITQLRAGAPFAVIATQFSHSQSALQGGEVGWRQANQMEPSVAQVVTQMPIGAVSNPIEVPGGFMIVSLHAKRTVGTDLQTVLDMRQAFLPFTSPLNPQAPTDQQKQTLAHARLISASAKSCDDIAAANKAAGEVRPADPGEVRLADVSPPAFQNLLATIPLQKASQPLVSEDGIVVLAVCSRAQKNVAAETDEQIAERLVNERADLISRQLERDLHRRGVIDVKMDEGSS